MPKMMSLRVVFLAAVGMVGCAGTGETPVGTENEAVDVARAEAAGKSKNAFDATTEVAAPESTNLHTPISSEELSRLTNAASATSAGKIEPDTIITCPACHFLEPDLTVVEDDRDQTICTPQTGCYAGYAKGFDVKNIGNWSAPTFHVAVLMGSDSYGFDVQGLAVGQSMYFQIKVPTIEGPACGQSAVVLVNPFNAIVESNYNNNSVVIQGYCGL